MMQGILGWSPQQIDSTTLRILIMCYEAHQIDRWNHTAQISFFIHNLTHVVVKAFGGKSKVKKITDFHPILRNEDSGLSISQKNFKDLKLLFSTK